MRLLAPRLKQTNSQARSKLNQLPNCLLNRRAHYELFIRALDAPNVSSTGVCLVHPTCGPTQVLASTTWAPCHSCTPLVPCKSLSCR